MKTLFSNTCVALSLLFMTTGCFNQSQKEVANTVSFDSLNKDIAYHMMENPEYPNCDLQISFTYPVKAENPELLKKLQQQFISSYFGDKYEELAPQEAVEQYTAEYLDSYKEMEDDFKMEIEHDSDAPIASWYSFFEVSGNEIVYNKNGILSYTVSVETYTGGAHGAHSLRSNNINMSNGEFITENDIFIEAFQDDLALLIIEDIATQNDVADIKELENKGFFSVDEIYPNGNFLIKEDGITYTFNEYEIAAYAIGTINVSFTFQELKALLLDNSPISHLFNP